MKKYSNYQLMTFVALFSVVMILATCKKDKATEEQVLTQHEQKIINKIDGFMPKEVELMFNNNFASHHGEKDYAIYLDSIETAIDELKNVVQVNFSLSDFEKAMSNSLINLQNSKGSVDCLGLGYSKGVSVDVIASGIVGSVIVIGLQASGGGGVKTIYDFVNLERQIYYYSLCGYGLSFGAGIAAALKAGLGFSGINEVITGIRYHGSSSGINNFEGQGVGRSFSLSQGIGVGIFSIGASVGIGTSNGAVADLNGINNLLPCPDNMVEIENGTKSYSFKVSGSGSVMVGFADLSTVLALNTTGTNSVGVKSSYTKFSSNKVLAGLMMAKEICLTGPMEGIVAMPGPTDLAASTVAIIYSFMDFSNCPAEIPAIGTKKINNLTSTSAVSGGIIKDNRGDNVSMRGVVWNKFENPTINTKMGITNDGQGIGEYPSTITSLTGNTTYYIRAYATNSAGTAYGSELTFTTSAAAPVIPTLTTAATTSITQTTATSGGNISSDGGASVTARGVCWSTTTNPTISLTTKTIDGSVTGSFTSSITGLTANITYYVKAYATNSVGTAYGNQVTFTTTSGGGTGTVTDIDGNVYNTVTIGTQVWMAENLKTTKYNDGTSIPNVTDNAAWVALITSAYCWYNNDVSYKNPYGALYNWYAVNTGKLAPAGWHVPTDAEWTTLTIFLGGESVAGGKLKETGTSHWFSPNTGATNSSGFSALPSGYRIDVNPFFSSIGYGTFFWSSTSYAPNAAYPLYLRSLGSEASNSGMTKIMGFSIRCIKN